MTTQTVGLVGLGNMGAALASRLLRAGSVLAYDRSEERRKDAAGAGATVVDSIADVGRADVVLLCLPTPAISRVVATDLADVMRPGSLLVETSTVNATDMTALGDLLGPKGIRVLDVAILSGVQPMLDGTAPLLAGGEKADLAEISELLAEVSGQVTHYGPLGAGMAAKVINNAVAHVVMVLLSEVSALGAASGIKVEQLVQMFSDPMAGLVRPLTHRLGERVAQGAYSGGMPTDAARKDSTLALEAAQQAGVPLFTIQAAHTAYELALAAGLGREDYASVATLWEGWTGREIR